MTATRAFRLSLTIAGAIVSLAGVAHFLWRLLMPGYSELYTLSAPQWRFLTLLNDSVGLLLLFMGATAISVAALRSSQCARFRFEQILPVPIPFFGIATSSGFLEVLIGVLLVILATPEVLLAFRLLRR